VAERWLIIPDEHQPHVDPAWEELTIKAAELVRPDVVLHLGDGIDAEAASSHAKSSFAEMDEVESLFTEFFGFAKHMNNLHRAARGCRFVIHAGNHEFRIQRMAAQIGGQFGRDVAKALDPQTHMTSELKGPVEWVDYSTKERNFYEITPNLISCHGWSYCEHVAAKHMKMAKGRSIVFGHCHRHQVFTDSGLDGNPIVAWSPGYGGQLQPYWRHGTPTNWLLGFSVVYVSEKDRTNWSVDHCLVKKRPNGGAFVTVKEKELRV